jgi:hypothetical protein
MIKLPRSIDCREDLRLGHADSRLDTSEPLEIRGSREGSNVVFFPSATAVRGEQDVARELRSKHEPDPRLLFLSVNLLRLLLRLVGANLLRAPNVTWAPLNHFAVATSPAMISFISGLDRVGSTMLRDEDRSARVFTATLDAVTGVTEVRLLPRAQ